MHRAEDLERELLRGVCPFCGKRVNEKGGFLSLGRLMGGEIRRPSVNEDEPVAYLSHAGCGPEDPYWIPLDQILDIREDDGRLWTWEIHIGQKRWDSDVYQRAIGIARKHVQQLTARASKPKRAKLRASLRSKVLERDGFTCRRCGRRPPDVELVVDHVTPVASGGATRLENLQTLCCDCNAGKSAREPHEHDKRGLSVR